MRALEEFGVPESQVGQVFPTTIHKESVEGDLLYISVYFKTLNERNVQTIAVYDVLLLTF